MNFLLNKIQNKRTEKTVKYYLSTAMNSTSKLHQLTHSDSEISKNITCTRTKPKAIANIVLVPHSVAMTSHDLN